MRVKCESLIRVNFETPMRVKCEPLMRMKCETLIRETCEILMRVKCEPLMRVTCETLIRVKCEANCKPLEENEPSLCGWLQSLGYNTEHLQITRSIYNLKIESLAHEENKK